MVKIPMYAKSKASSALKKRKVLPKSQQYGLEEDEAKALGINSGVSRARQIIKSYKLSEEDAKAVARFYGRFKGCKTKKCEGALDLWGGRRFGKKLYEEFYG